MSYLRHAQACGNKLVAWLHSSPLFVRPCQEMVSEKCEREIRFHLIAHKIKKNSDKLL